MSDTNNPYLETRGLAPAMIGAMVAAGLTFILALAVLVAVFPAQVRTISGSQPLDIAALGAVLRAFVLGTNCAAGLAKWIGLDCRVVVLSDTAAVVLASSGARISAIVTVLAPAAAFVIAYLEIIEATPKRERVRTLRGSRPVYDADARTSLRAALRPTGSPAKSGLWIAPHVQLTQRAEGYNLLAIGTQGSGKTSTLRALIEQMIARGDRVVVHDVKGDMHAGLPVDRTVLLAPHDQRSWAYDIAADIGNREHAREFAAHAIQPSGNDAMWGQGAQAIWTDLVMSLRTERGPTWSWGDLSDVLLSSGATIRDRLQSQGSPMAARIVFGSGDPEENRTTMSLLITMWVAALAVVEPLALAWADVPPGRRFSLRAWLATPSRLPRVVVLQKSSEYPGMTGGASAFLVDRLIGLALRPGGQRNPNRRLALCIDELPEWSRLNRLPNLLNVGREFGVVTLAGVQDFASLVQIYGDEATNVLLARFRIKIVHQLEAGDTAERVHALLGQRRIELTGPMRRDMATGRATRDDERETADVVPVDRLASELGPHVKNSVTHIRVMVMGLGKPAIVDIPLTVWRERRAGHVPARWLEPPTTEI